MVSCHSVRNMSDSFCLFILEMVDSMFQILEAVLCQILSVWILVGRSFRRGVLWLDVLYNFERNYTNFVLFMLALPLFLVLTDNFANI